VLHTPTNVEPGTMRRALTSNYFKPTSTPPPLTPSLPNLITPTPIYTTSAPPRLAMQPLELTLIVAATRNMGIGAHGTMPWTGLRKEMQYFARVTTRLPPQVRGRPAPHFLPSSSCYGFAHFPFWPPTR